MNLRWLVGNFADPEFRLTRQQQRQVTELAHRKYLSRQTLASWTAGMSLAGFLLLGFGWDPLAGLLARIGIQPARVIAMIGMVTMICVAAAWLYRFIYLGPVRLAMRDIGYDICIGCGYRLAGLMPDITRCPECGHSRTILPDSTRVAPPDA